jgi:hypothetical protein
MGRTDIAVLSATRHTSSRIPKAPRLGSDSATIDAAVSRVNVRVNHPLLGIRAALTKRGAPSGRSYSNRCWLPVSGITPVMTKIQRLSTRRIGRSHPPRCVDSGCKPAIQDPSINDEYSPRHEPQLDGVANLARSHRQKSRKQCFERF